MNNRTVWLSLGSNLGNRKNHLEKAVILLGDLMERLVESPIYETAARDLENQPDFLNMVIRGECILKPINLLERLHDIETRLGRNRSREIPKGPRTLDIDILLYGNQVLGTGVNPLGSLIIPHPAMDERLFVLKPLLDIDPDLCDPRDAVPWAQKASRLLEQEVKLYEK